MKTIQITVEDNLLYDVDKYVGRVGGSRSSFIRQAMKDALHKMQVLYLEDKHRRGYKKHPCKPGEFDAWEDEQTWGE